jgi:hypothetical protein
MKTQVFKTEAVKTIKVKGELVELNNGEYAIKLYDGRIMVPVLTFMESRDMTGNSLTGYDEEFYARGMSFSNKINIA